MGRAHEILVVDDDPNIRQVVTFALERAGFVTREASDGEAALESFAAHSADLIILDVLMPELNGTDVCRRIRMTSRVPIVFLSSRDDEIDRVLGLELGGDDYVTKPFSPRELVARVRAILRRLDEDAPAAPAATATTTAPSPAEATSPPHTPRTMTYGKLVLDLDAYKATWDGEPVPLTVTEFGVVKTLMGYPHKVYTRDELMRGAYRDDTIVSDRTIDSHVTRVRRKFRRAGGDPIETVHGLGYTLCDLQAQ